MTIFQRLPLQSFASTRLLSHNAPVLRKAASVAVTLNAIHEGSGLFEIWHRALWGQDAIGIVRQEDSRENRFLGHYFSILFSVDLVSIDW